MSLCDTQNPIWGKLKQWFILCTQWDGSSLRGFLPEIISKRVVKRRAEPGWDWLWVQSLHFTLLKALKHRLSPPTPAPLVVETWNVTLSVNTLSCWQQNPKQSGSSGEGFLKEMLTYWEHLQCFHSVQEYYENKTNRTFQLLAVRVLT